MRKRICLVVMFLINLSMWPNSSYCIEDKVIVIVNNEVITKGELETHIKLLKLQIGQENWQRHQMTKEKALVNLIEDRLIVQEARDSGLEIEDRLVEARIERIKKRYRNQGEMSKSLLQQGLSLVELKERIREQMLSDRLITLEIRNKIFVSPKEVTDYYQNNIDDFYLPERVQVESIFVEDKRLSQEIYAKLKNGVDFVGLQEQYSQKKSLGLVSRGELLSEIEQVIFDLEIGAFSQPVGVNEEGYFVFLIRDKHPSEGRALIEVQKAVTNIISEIKFNAKLKKLLDNLKDKSYIVIKDD